VGAVHGTEHFRTLWEHAGCKYLAQLPGNSYSARLKYLLATGSAVIMYQRNPTWQEFWYHLLKVGKRCVLSIYRQQTLLHALLKQPTPATTPPTHLASAERQQRAGGGSLLRGAPRHALGAHSQVVA
jgi:hypothetical protein